MNVKGNKLFFSLLFFSLFFSGMAQEKFLWPLPDGKTGENILYRPNDYIGDEPNHSDLILSGNENYSVVSPISGVVTTFTYVYQKRYSSSTWFRVTPTSDYQSDCNEILKYYPQEGYDPKYISITMGIKTADNRTVYVSGIRPTRIFKTGEKIAQGENIGTMGYLYYKINKPAISIAVSKNGTADDPMTPFGLKSTFKKYVKKEISNLTPEEVLEDIDILIKSTEEGYPGLYDYLSPDEWEVLISSLKKQVTEEMSLFDFYMLLSNSFVYKMRDNHFRIASNRPFNKNENYVLSSVTFGFLNDSLIITKTKMPYIDFYGKKISKVNGVTADSIRRLVLDRIRAGDGLVQSHIDNELLFWSFDIFGEAIDNYENEYLIEFDDDTTVLFTPLKESGNRGSCIPYNTNWRYFHFHNRDSLTLMKIENSIAYIGLHSFYLTEVELDGIAAFIKQLNADSCKNLIIDLRNNSGGDEGVCAKLFSFFAQKPFLTQEYYQVNKRNNFNFFRYCTNYNEEVSDLFMEYESVSSKNGYFAFNQDTIYPDADVHFSGNLYVITNESSLSAATDFAGLVHKYQRGVLVGRETGNTYHQMNALKFANLLLPHSQIEISIPLVKVVFDTQERGIPYGRGVLPHYPVNFSLEEISWENGDVMLNYAIELIHNEDYLPTEAQDTAVGGNSSPKPILWILFVFGVSVLLIIGLFCFKKS